MQNIIYLDVETGGLNPQNNALSSISVECEGDLRTWYIQPYGKTYEAQAIMVNGLSKEILTIKGQPLEIVFKELKQFFLQYTKTDKFGNLVKPKLCGHNLRFDLDFLREFYSAFGTTIFKFVDYHYLDTMHYAQVLNDLGQTKFITFKLVDIYRELFGEDSLSANAHTSDADILMTKKVRGFFIEKFGK